MLIEYIVYITFCFKTIQVKWIFEFVFRTLIRRQSESMVNRTRINSAQSIFFRRQAISHVPKFNRVLVRDFMIQWVILIFINCISANQNKLFYMKV